MLSIWKCDRELVREREPGFPKAGSSVTFIESTEHGIPQTYQVDLGPKEGVLVRAYTADSFLYDRDRSGASSP